MPLLDQIALFDHSLFLVINSIIPHFIVFDIFFIFLSIVGSLGIVWILIAFYFVVHHPQKHKYTMIRIVMANVISLVVVEFGIKNIIKRPRPEFTLPDVRVVGDPLTTYSFPSTHSAFAFASAFVLSKLFPKYTRVWYILAILIGFSRIYLEKHYPLDVIGGAVIGTLIGWAVMKIKNKNDKDYDKT